MESPANALPESPAPPAAGLRRPSFALLAIVFVVLCVSRLAVFPASIWDQDEAYFAAAVVKIDLDASSPHPPFFPLWIGIGRIVALLGFAPAMSLQLASAIFGSLVFLPLVALWSRFTTPTLAMAAAALGLVAPGVWLLSGRAFSGTAATTMLVTALVFWTRPNPDRRWSAAGSVAAGLSILIRPHVALVVAAVIVVMLIKRDRRDRLAIIAPTTILTVAGTTIFVIAAGGPSATTAAFSRHMALHFGALPNADRGLLGSGLTMVLGHPAAAIAWCVFTTLGMWIVLRSPRTRGAGLPVAAALVASIVLVFGLSNPAHPRYAVPLVILSCGFVVIGLNRLLREPGALAVITLGVGGAAWLVLPVATTYRQIDSPPLRALAYADRTAVQTGGMVVVDRHLHSFVVMREASSAASAPTYFDHMLKLGAIPATPASHIVVVFDAGHEPLLVGSGHRKTFTCDRWLLRRLGQGRFLDVTVADGAIPEDRSAPERSIPNPD